jgi:N-glycosylase/DNA lyase
MSNLINEIEKLKNSSIARTVSQRMKEFRQLGGKSSREIFKELCFCLLTANYSAAGGIKIQKAIDDGFMNFSELELSGKLKELGHRFPNARARFIVEARKHANNIKDILSSFSDKEAREWLVENIKGLGMKEASHFLRNIGFTDCAIIDFHITDILAKNNLIEKPKALTPKKYIEIENVLRRLAEKTSLSLAELDLYLWHIETGKILK